MTGALYTGMVSYMHHSSIIQLKTTCIVHTWYEYSIGTKSSDCSSSNRLAGNFQRHPTLLFNPFVTKARGDPKHRAVWYRVRAVQIHQQPPLHRLVSQALRNSDGHQHQHRTLTAASKCRQKCQEQCQQPVNSNARRTANSNTNSTVNSTTKTATSTEK